MEIVRHVKVFKNGRNRAIRIPVEFDFPGDEVIMRKEGDKIIIEPFHDDSDFFKWLESRKPWGEGEFPDLDLKDPPAEDVDL
jgi:antitoxin VapB